MSDSLTVLGIVGGLHSVEPQEFKGSDGGWPKEALDSVRLGSALQIGTNQAHHFPLGSINSALNWSGNDIAVIHAASLSREILIWRAIRFLANAQSEKPLGRELIHISIMDAEAVVGFASAYLIVCGFHNVNLTA